MSTRSSLSPLLLQPTTAVLPVTRPNDFLLSLKVYANLPIGCVSTRVSMFVWSPPENIGFLSTTSSKTISPSPWLIRNMSALSVARKPTKRILSGLQTYTSMGSYLPALSRLDQFVNCGTCSVTGTNSFV